MEKILEGLELISAGILDIVIPVIALFIGSIIAKGAKLIKIKIIKDVVKGLILSAYQQFETGKHKEKFEYVANRIHQKFPLLSEEEIKDYIEEAVKIIKIEYLGEINA